jgi:hypothetical protein
MIPDLDLLARLRDAHPPVEPGWWPPAPGWWLLLALVVALAAIGIRHAPGWWRRLRMRRRLLGALESAATPAEVSQLLRIAVLERFPEHAAAGLLGERWVAFLESCDRVPGRFEGLRETLSVAPYRAEEDGVNVCALRIAARGWMRAVL